MLGFIHMHLSRVFRDIIPSLIYASTGDLMTWSKHVGREMKTKDLSFRSKSLIPTACGGPETCPILAVQCSFPQKRAWMAMYPQNPGKLDHFNQPLAFQV